MHRGRAAPAIGQAGGMAHQVLYRDRSFDGHGFDRALSCEDALIQHRDAPVAELGQKSLDRIGQLYTVEQTINGFV